MRKSLAPRQTHDIVVMGASAGGLNPLLEIIRSLPMDLRAAVFIVIHSGTSDVLTNLIARSTGLSVRRAEDGDEILWGRIYVARPDYHLLVTDRGTILGHGPKENGFRPAVDPLFRTAVKTFGARVVGVILSGALDDGTHGLGLIKAAGGIAIVQDPQEAFMPSMPMSACRNVEVDYVLPAAEIASAIARITAEGAEESDGARTRGATMGPDDQVEPDSAEAGTEALVEHLYKQPPSVFTCPECGGTLWELDDKHQIRYRCHVGHGFSAESLLAGQDEKLEAALWTAVRALDEAAALSRRMSGRAHQGRLDAIRAAYDERAESSQEQANVIRELLVSRPRASLKSDTPRGPKNGAPGEKVIFHPSD